MPATLPRLRHSLIAAAALSAALLVPAAVPQAAEAAKCSGAGAHPAEVSNAVARNATLCLLNKRRASHGVPSLRDNGKLRKAASRHSRDMVERRYFSHTSLNGDGSTDRIRATGYLSGSRSWATGENIGWGADYRATPRAMVSAWMNSTGHRANILSRNYRHIGVGIVRGAPVRGVPPAATYTTDFGRN